jgi:ABC-type Fe3+/spermidine/putrescine transport system ATPase subunit
MLQVAPAAFAAVASFFGSPNLLPATVVGCMRVNEGEFEVSVRGTWTGVCRAGAALAAGSDVFVMVRPENVGLAVDESGAGDGRGVLSGRVVQSSFHGARRAVTMEVNGNVMRAEMPARAPIGERVSVTIDGRAA